MPHLVQQETTLAYLENQIAAALMLQSSHEYHHWLLIYARYLVNEGETCQALVLLCSSDGLLRNTLFMSWICVIALNVLLLVLGFWARGLLKTRINCICFCSAQSSGILVWHSDWEQTMVWGSSAICRLQEWQLHCEKAQWSVRHILGIVWQQLQMFQANQQHLVKWITFLSQLTAAAWCEMEGLLRLWHFVPEHIKLQRICFYCLHFILFYILKFHLSVLVDSTC